MKQYLPQVWLSWDCFYAPAVFVTKREILKILSRENCHYMQISSFLKFWA